MKRWYVVRTKPGYEGIAERNLLRQKFDVFAPVIVQKIPRKGREPVERTVRLFGCYLLVQFDIKRHRRWRSINGTTGCIKLLPQHSELPIPISTQYVLDLKRMAAKGDIDIQKVLTKTLQYQPRQRVEMTDGPLAGLTGEFQYYRETVAYLLVGLLGGQTLVAVDHSQTRLA